MRSIALVSLLVALNGFSFPAFCTAQVVQYEADQLPAEDGWIVAVTYCAPDVWLDDGWLYQHVELCPGDDPPGGQTEGYQRSLAAFDGAPDFFVEWRVKTDAPHGDLFPWNGGALPIAVRLRRRKLPHDDRH